MRYDPTWYRCPSCESSVPAASARCPSCGSERASPAAGRSRDDGSTMSTTESARPRNLELPPMRLARGMRISVYQIESVAGEGGMGVVYRAWDEAIGRPVALKCLHNNLCGDP